jgi:hypothetical protein
VTTSGKPRFAVETLTPVAQTVCLREIIACAAPPPIVNRAVPGDQLAAALLPLDPLSTVH